MCPARCNVFCNDCEFLSKYEIVLFTFLNNFNVQK